MDRETFETIYQNQLTLKQKEVLHLFLQGMRDEQIATQMGNHERSGITKHLKSIYGTFGIISGRDRLVELFIKYKPHLVHPEVCKKYGYILSPPRYPEGYEPLNSAYYLERPFVDSLCYQAIKEPGALIRIKAPNQMGKTSLLKRIIEQAKNYNYHTVYIDLNLKDTHKLQNSYNFLRGFYTSFKEEFDSAPPLTEWDADGLIMTQCTRQFQQILKELKQNIVLIIDNVDRIFGYLEIYQDFFPMLRYWHEKAKESETWEKLRLVIAHSTEDYGKLNIHQSPFGNVGLPIHLEELNFDQVQTLAIRHGLEREYANPLISMVGGHPYLIRLAYYHLYYQYFTIEQLLNDAPTNAGIYQQHLLRHLETLQKNQDLGEVFRQIVTQAQPVRLENRTIQVYQLESMGLIKIEGNLAIVRCNLYRLYFGDRLN